MNKLAWRSSICIVCVIRWIFRVDAAPHFERLIFAKYELNISFVEINLVMTIILGFQEVKSSNIFLKYENAANLLILTLKLRIIAGIYLWWPDLIKRKACTLLCSDS